MNLIYGLSWHILRLLTFTHPGRGIPARYNGTLLLLIGLAMLGCVLRWTILGDMSLVRSVVPFSLYCLVLAGLFGPGFLTVAVLASIGVDLVAIPVILADLPSGLSSNVLSLWEVSAMCVGYFKLQRALGQAEAHCNEKSDPEKG